MELNSYKESRAALLEYIRTKLAAEDFHAVRDAVVDVEVLDTQQDAEKDAQDAARYRWLRKHALPEQGLKLVWHLPHNIYAIPWPELLDHQIDSAMQSVQL